MQRAKFIIVIETEHPPAIEELREKLILDTKETAQFYLDTKTFFREE